MRRRKGGRSSKGGGKDAPLTVGEFNNPLYGLDGDMEEPAMQHAPPVMRSAWDSEA